MFYHGFLNMTMTVGDICLLTKYLVIANNSLLFDCYAVTHLVVKLILFATFHTIK